ncbi:MAG: helix-turn-helix domain-containing protein [Acidimicrobiales bacterium]
MHRDGSARRMGAEPKPASVPELARVLRQTRAARGLELFSVSQQTGIPLNQLQDLESGTVDRLPDRVEVLKALSRYAAFLHLPGDQFVMTLVEHWPAPGITSAIAGTNGLQAATDTGVGVRATAPPPPAVSDLSTRAVPLSNYPTSGIATSIGLPPVLEGRHSSTAPVPTVMADTGRTPAIRRGGPDGLLMVFVRSLVVVITILVVIGTAWLVVNHLRPQWLADLHLPYTSSGVMAAPTGTQVTSTPKTTPTSTAPKPAMTLVSASGDQAAFSVNAPTFDVLVSATGGDAWVKASGPTSTKPEFEGIVKSGQSQLVTANHQLTVIVGSTAARIAVEVGQHVIGTYVPPGAPFTMTFTTK